MTSKRYDTVVIGSGVHGLSVAALLAHLGYKTLVVEKLSEIGGRFSTVDYNGYKIPTGGCMIPQAGSFKRLCDEIGVEFQVCAIPQATYLIDGKKFRPPPKGGIAAILAQLCKSEAELSRILNAIRRTRAWELPSDEITLRDWLLQYTDNEMVLEFFNNLCVAWIIINSWEASAKSFFQFLFEVMSDWTQSALAPQGSIVLMESLARVVREKGGDVWTSCTAKEILVTDGIAQGIIVDKDGEGEIEVAAKVVISDTGPKETIRLAGSGNFDEGHLREVSRMVSGIMFSAAIVSDRPLYDEPVIVTLKARRMLSLIDMTLPCPQLAPPGKHLYITYSAPKSMTEPCDFKEEADLLVQDLSDNIPEFEKHGEVLHMACFRGDWPVVRNVARVGYSPISRKTPVENLYNVGDGVGSFWEGGSSGAAEAAREVADDIKARIKPGEN